MAEDDAPAAPPSGESRTGRRVKGSGGGGGIGAMLTRPVGPAPLWVWVALGTIGLVLFLKHKQAAGSTSGTSGGPTGNTGDSSTWEADSMLPEAGAMPYSGGDVYVNSPVLSVNPTATATTTAGSTTAPSNYVGAQWQAGQKVVIGGTPGVADPWDVLAKKILSTNTIFTGPDHSTVNQTNINRAVAALKAANPGLAKKYPTAVPNTNTLVIPTIPGLNAAQSPGQ